MHRPACQFAEALKLFQSFANLGSLLESELVQLHWVVIFKLADLCRQLFRDLRLLNLYTSRNRFRLYIDASKVWLMASTFDSTFEGGSWSEDKEEARFHASVHREPVSYEGVGPCCTLDQVLCFCSSDVRRTPKFTASDF